MNEETFAQKLKAARAKTRGQNGRQLSQAKLAEKINVPRRTYEDWETGKFEPDPFKQIGVLEAINKISKIVSSFSVEKSKK